MLPSYVRTPETAYVAQALVHKHNADQVLLTGWRRTSEDEFALTARWPEQHSFYAVTDNLHDPLLLSETIRQTFPLLSHAAYDVPQGHPLLWEHYTYGIDCDALRAGGLPHTIDLRVIATEVDRRGARVTALALAIDVFRGPMLLGTASTRFTIQTPAVYRRLRAERSDPDLIEPSAPGAPLPPTRVGRSACRDVLLSPTQTPRHHRLRFDTSHPYYFDHRVDHVPGMLLLEAARQAAQEALFPLPVVAVGMDNQFHRYVELDTPCDVEAKQLPSDEKGFTRVRVTMRQNGAEHYATTVTLAPSPTPSRLPATTRALPGRRPGRASRRRPA
jgi:hypothetical protein